MTVLRLALGPHVIASAILQDRFQLAKAAMGHDLSCSDPSCLDELRAPEGVDTEIPEQIQQPMRNVEGIMRRAIYAQHLLHFRFKKAVALDEPLKALKREQRSLQRQKYAALDEQKARKHAKQFRQQRITKKWVRAHSRGTGIDVPTTPTYYAPMHKRTIEFHPDYYQYDYDGRKDPVPDDEDFGATIMPGRGWRVVATYVIWDRDQPSYYLAINPATEQAILSPFLEGSRYMMSSFEEDIDAALRSVLSTRKDSFRLLPWVLALSCSDMLHYARSRLDPVDPTQQLQQQASYGRAVEALYATFLWACPLVLSAGQFAPWMVWVWAPYSYCSVVRLQARVRGWLVRRELYSPYTELGQRRLQRLWASFEDVNKEGTTNTPLGV